VKSRESAKVLASNLMKRPDVKQAITDLMDQKGLTQEYRVERLKSHVDHADPNISLKALDQSWRLDGSYAPERRINLDVAVTPNYRLFRAYKNEEELLNAFPKVQGQCDICGLLTDHEFCGECQEKYSFLIARIIKTRLGQRSPNIIAGEVMNERERD
jgi:hypothetical protein